MHVSAPGSPSSNYMAPSEAEDQVKVKSQTFIWQKQTCSLPYTIQNYTYEKA